MGTTLAPGTGLGQELDNGRARLKPRLGRIRVSATNEKATREGDNVQAIDVLFPELRHKMDAPGAHCR